MQLWKNLRKDESSRFRTLVGGEELLPPQAPSPAGQRREGGREVADADHHLISPMSIP